MENLSIGTVWEDKLYPGKLVRIVETSPRGIVFEVLPENGWIPRPRISRSRESFSSRHDLRES